MKILKNRYEDILQNTPFLPFGKNCILGRKNEMIINVCFDISVNIHGPPTIYNLDTVSFGYRN